VACVGDSITEGVGSADWVAMLRDRVGPQDVQVVNAGVAGDLAWNVLQRLDAVIQCEPDMVSLMVGTNDVALEPKSSMNRFVLRMKGVRQAPAGGATATQSRPARYQAKGGPMMKAQFQHHVLHRSDAASARNGLVLLSDHTHLGERAAQVVADLVAEFVTAP
jgi:hypothetical protein